MANHDVKNLAQGMVRLFAPFCEVILHDLKTGTVADVMGMQSTRMIGEPSYLDDLNFYDWTDNIQGPYRKTMPDGRSVKSISILCRSSNDEPKELLCINIDVSQFEVARALLSAFTSIPEKEVSNPLANDWLEGLHTFVANWTFEKGVQLKDLQSDMRKNLISELEKNDVFKQKNAAQAVAKAIGVSRATIYQDLRKNNKS